MAPEARRKIEMMTCDGEHRRVVATLAAGLMSFGAWAAAGHDHRSASTSSLPESREKELVTKYCTACHGIQRLERAGGTHAGWLDRIGRMQRWGSRLPAAEMDAVAAYLAAALPPRARPAESLTYFANQAVQEARVQDIQSTLRFAARAVAPNRLVLDAGTATDASMLQTGQRARAFAPHDRGTYVPGWINVVRSGDDPLATLRTVRRLDAQGRPAIVEVTLNQGRRLAVANDAILTEGEISRVFVEQESGQFEARMVSLGIAGDQVTEITAGLHTGEKVITLGVFFVDAEQRLGR